MKSVDVTLRAPGRCSSVRSFVFWITAVLCVSVAHVGATEFKRSHFLRVRPAEAVVLTQLPAAADVEKSKSVSGGMLRAAYGQGARLILISADSSVQVLSDGFHSACDPEVSFDAKHILFAGKRTASDDWNVYEMAVDGSGVRQITREMGNCRSPGYQSTLYTIVSPKPWYQLTFVGDAAGNLNEFGSAPATNLYSCMLDGSGVRRLTFNLSSDMDPFIMSDGRLLFASWQRRTLDHGVLGRVGLFGVNIDGTDFAALATDQGRRIKHTPCVTAKGLLVFVEADKVPWDGAGYLSCVSMRRPLHSYRRITGQADGLFHTPSPLPDGRILVSQRSRDGKCTHGLYRFDPLSQKMEPIFDDPRYHEIQAKLVAARAVPDGRSSVVRAEDPHGKLYCLDVYTSDLEQRSWMPPGTIKRLRVLEGVPQMIGVAETHGEGLSANGIPPLAGRRIFGEIPVGEDGSFNIKIPANAPVELQILDADGMALRSCGWIWAKNHEPRGCVGCHEDGELTPENWFVDALSRPPVFLGLPAEQRRTVDFRRDVMPLITEKCASCHRKGQALPYLDGGLKPVSHAAGATRYNRAYLSLLRPPTDGESEKTYVHPGKARTSPLIWQIFGRNTSRAWDKAAGPQTLARGGRCKAKESTEDEKRTFIEWIDLGALWDGIPGPDDLSEKSRQTEGQRK